MILFAAAVLKIFRVTEKWRGEVQVMKQCITDIKRGCLIRHNVIKMQSPPVLLLQNLWVLSVPSVALALRYYTP